MAKIRVRYFTSLKRGGRTLFYWQPSSELRALGWTPMRLSDVPEEALDQARARNAELDAWRAGRVAPAAPAVDAAPAPRAVAKAAPGTVDELIRAYKASAYWQDLRPKTRRSYEQCLTRIADWAGDKPRAAITPKMVQDFYRITRRATPAFAAAIVRVGQLLWSRGRLMDLVGSANPFAEQNVKGGGKSGLIWPRAAIDWMVAAADAMGRPSIGTAILVNSWIGQRQADVLRLGRGVLAAGGRATRQAKTGSIARLPMNVIPEVVARVEWQLAANDADAKARAGADEEPVLATTLLVDEHTGRPWHEDTFRHEFAAVRAEAERLLEGAAFEIDWLRPGKDGNDPEAYRLRLGDLQFMHLRHTAVVYLAEAGVDILAIAAVTGHSPRTCQQILDTYGIKTGRLAEQAFKRRLAHEAKTVN